MVKCPRSKSRKRKRARRARHEPSVFSLTNGCVGQDMHGDGVVRRFDRRMRMRYRYLLYRYCMNDSDGSSLWAWYLEYKASNSSGALSISFVMFLALLT
jgi:hypothetical protein